MRNEVKGCKDLERITSITITLLQESNRGYKIKLMNGKRILIVDDDHDIVDAMEAILMMEDYVVMHAYDGNGGIQKAHDCNPQIILLDYMLPDITGKEVAQAIQSHPELHKIPIILVSAAREAQETSKNLGLAGYIEKPFDMDVLLQTVKQHIT